MEINELLDRLEKCLSGGGKVPFTNKSMVNVEECLEVLDQIRAALPTEIREAQYILREREKVLAEARQEAEKIKNLTQAQVEKLLEENALTKEAKDKADKILSKAQQVAQEIRQGANQYADDLLAKLEIHLEKTLAVVKRGRQELEGSSPMGGNARESA
ncbi:MAG: ATPase [Clostridia bacterium]|nr:ATPase [Clostridia bacterium]